MSHGVGDKSLVAGQGEGIFPGATRTLFIRYGYERLPEPRRNFGERLEAGGQPVLPYQVGVKVTTVKPKVRDYHRSGELSDKQRGDNERIKLTQLGSIYSSDDLAQWAI